MRTAFRWGLRLFLAVLVVAGGLVFYGVVIKSPKTAPPSSIRVEATPARIERGRHLVNVVTGCFECHAERDFSQIGRAHV